MRASVFTDAGLRKQAGRFVWLSVDTEKAGNAGFLEKFPLDTWPTLFLIEPAEERPVLKWLGSASVKDLERLLSDGERAVRLSGATVADAALARADRENGAGRATEAAPLYREALAKGGPRWPGRGRAAASLLLAQGEAEDWEGCAREGQSAPGALADDVAGLYEELVGAREARGDGPGARALARRWWDYLEAR